MAIAQNAPSVFSAILDANSFSISLKGRRKARSSIVFDKSRRLISRIHPARSMCNRARFSLPFTIPKGFSNWRMKKMDPRWGDENRRGESAGTSRRCIHCAQPRCSTSQSKRYCSWNRWRAEMQMGRECIQTKTARRDVAT